jgi:opacity protein-like surface antigen
MVNLIFRGFPMRASIFGLSLAAILASGTFAAQAADLIVDVAPVEPAAAGIDWSGFYAGGNLGYAWGTFDYHSPDAPVNDYQDDADGFSAGLQAGYNWQFDQIVVGLQSEFAYLAGEGDDGDKIQWLGSTTGRLGLAFDSLLVYGKAGLAYGLSDVSFDSFGTLYEDGEWHVGWTAGAGLEYAIADGVSAFVEYNYTDLGAQTYFANVPPIGPNGVEIGYTSHAVKAGVNFKF